MNTASIDHLISTWVFDTSHRTCHGNWQWGTVDFDRSWDAVADLIHLGWPAKEGKFTNQQAIMLGVIRHSDLVWLYRIYPAGREKSGRPGRYFFVVFRLPSPDMIDHPQVAGLLAYFEKERGLPLNLKHLEQGWPDGKADPTLLQLREECQEQPRSSHWGMDGNCRVLHFKYLEEPRAQAGHGTSTGAGKLALAAGLVLVSAIGGFLLKQYNKGGEGVKTSTAKTQPSGSLDTLTPEKDASSENSEQQGDKQIFPEDSHTLPKSISEDKAPPNLKPAE